jgi:hypothetical protein
MPGPTHRPARRMETVAAAAVVALMSVLTPLASADNDVLMQAINYVFTGRIDPERGPELVDRNACVVTVPAPGGTRAVRYHLSRFRLDAPRFEKVYVGRTPNYRLVAEGDDNVVEFLNPDKSVLHGQRTVQIPLPGDFEQSQRALRVIAERCKATRPKPSF